MGNLRDILSNEHNKKELNTKLSVLFGKKAEYFTKINEGAIYKKENLKYISAKMERLL